MLIYTIYCETLFENIHYIAYMFLNKQQENKKNLLNQGLQEQGISEVAALFRTKKLSGWMNSSVRYSHNYTVTLSRDFICMGDESFCCYSFLLISPHIKVSHGPTWFCCQHVLLCENRLLRAAKILT